MTTYQTGNPIGSTDPKDLYDNAENLDTAVNDPSRDTWSDRLGRSRKTMSGMERQFDAAEDYRETTFVSTQIYRQNRFNSFIAASGYSFVGDYASGIEITEYNQIVRDDDGEFWRLSGQVELPYTTTGAGVPEGGALVPLGDAVLRQQLADSTQGSRLVGFDLEFPGSVTRNVFEKVAERVSVKDFGAVGDGGVDDSTSFERASAYAEANGGVVYIPRGTYRIQGITLREGVTYMGDGQARSILRLPDSPSSHMFTAPPGTGFNGGGFFDLHFFGVEGSGFDAIDFSQRSRIDEFHIDSCLIARFRRGFNGSWGGGPGNDRFPVIRNSRFHYNEIGIYTNEHAILHTLDLRFNDIGLSGRINDIHAVNVKFNYNRIGCIGDPTITNSTFSACIWYGNEESGGVFDNSVTVSDCMVSGINDPGARGGLGDVGLHSRGNLTVISGCRFGQFGASTSFADAAILVERTSSSQNHEDLRIDSNLFSLLGSGVGVRVVDGLNILGLGVTNNNVTSRGNPFLSLSNLYGPEISNNIVRLSSALSSGQSLISWTALIRGGVFSGNSFENVASDVGHALSGPSTSAGLGVYGNNFSRFLEPVNLSGQLGASQFIGNLGYVTEDSGIATIPSGGTSVTVPYSMDRPVTGGKIQVTPTGSGYGLSNATKFWLSDVGAGSFDILVDQDPGRSIQFRWVVGV